MARVSIVVPVYGNAQSLPGLVDRLQAVADSMSGDVFEFVFVDDGSGDDSFSVLESLAARCANLRAVRLSRNFGSNVAVVAGLTYAHGDCAVVIAADLQDPPELIPRLVERWREGNKVVIAARRRRRDPMAARIFAAIFNRLFRSFVFADYPAGGFDFMLIDRRVVDILVGIREKNSYLFGQALWVGFPRALVHYDRQERRHGRSRWTTAKKIKYFIDAFAAFSYLPIRVASFLGVALAALGFLYALVIVVVRFTSGVPVTGWASLTVVVLVTSGAQLVVVGVLGEYLWRALDETRRRPLFIVDAVVNCEGSALGWGAERGDRAD
jgi:glycosyltransferase involved in cell wall biosynthesis